MPIDPRAGIGAVCLVVADLERSVRFYTGPIGLRDQGRDGDAVALGADGRTPLLLLTEERGAAPPPEGTTGLYHFAILTPSREELGRSLLRLVEADYPLSGASDHLVSEALYLDDPDGNGIEIYRDRPAEEWPRSGTGVRMGNAPLDLEGLLRAAGEGAPALDPATRIGHIHLHVGDLRVAEAFYVDTVGFEVTQRWNGALFVSAGGYHHHLGLNTWAGEGAPAPPPGSAGLRSYSLALPDEEARADVAGRLERAGFQAGEEGGAPLIADPWGHKILLDAPATASRRG
jgi:catechol 2,3-dioxygenase